MTKPRNFHGLIPDKKDGLNYKEYLFYLNLVFNLSWTIVTFIAVSGVAGFFLDKFFFKKPGVFFVIFLILGVLAGFVHSYFMIVKKIDKKIEKK